MPVHSLPARMRHIEVLAEEGGILRLATGPVPAPGPGEVLIRVIAAGINRPDVLQRQGVYPPPPGASPILGLEVAGEVVAVGEGVSEARVGDAVCALTPGGGYAEYALAPASHCLPIPTGLSWEQAAALPETFFTVWHNVFQRGGLRTGENFLVHGGSSGIGTTAIQLAAAWGARVFTTAGSPEKCRACEALGATRAICHTQEDFVEVCRRDTAGEGIHLILDMVGGDYVDRNLRAAALEGRMVSIAFLKGARVEINAALLMMKRLTWTGSTLRAQGIEAKAGMARELREQVWPLLESGRIRPVLSRVFPLEEAGEAHRVMEAGEHIGKLVLRVAAS